MRCAQGMGMESTGVTGQRCKRDGWTHDGLGVIGNKRPKMISTLQEWEMRLRLFTQIKGVTCLEIKILFSNA